MRKTVLITGASSGIGEATAKYFLKQGWNVSATMRLAQSATPKEPSEVARDWTQHSAVLCPRLDVTIPETITTAIDKTISQFGRIDALVNNAGYALMGPIEAIRPEQLDQQFQTNVFGVVAMMQAILPLFRHQGYGTIVNVSSIGGRVGFPMTAAYHGTKWAIEGISEAMYYELRPFGIRIKIIEPGGIKTNFINRGATWATHAEYTQMINQIKQFMHGINDRLAEPDRVAQAIYRATNDRSQRLRYSPHAEMLLFLHAILPERWWRSLVHSMMLSNRRIHQSSP
jgi:NAD(P)-dependent dehydrogenase (short-subunit alcohol dehydrogenase family)